MKVQGYEVSFIPEERVRFPTSVRQSYDSVSFGYPNGEDGYEGFGTWKAHMINFRGMCKMLPAVAAGRKGNIRNAQSTVAQKKGGLFHTLAVNISIDSAAVFSVKSACR